MGWATKYCSLPGVCSALPGAPSAHLEMSGELGRCFSKKRAIVFSPQKGMVDVDHIYFMIFDDWSYWCSWQGWLVGWLDCFPIISHVVFCSPHKSAEFSPWAKAVFLCFLVTDRHRFFTGTSTGRLNPIPPDITSYTPMVWSLCQFIEEEALVSAGCWCGLTHGESQNLRRRNMARWQRRIPKTLPILQMICSDVPMKTSSNPNLPLLVFGLKKMIFQHFSGQVWLVNWSVGAPEVCIPFKGMPDPQWPAVCWWRPSFFKVNHPNPWAIHG